MNVLLLLFSILLSISITGCVSLFSSSPPLPTTLNIQAPSPDIPPEIAAFSGIWEGKWGAIQDTIIVIERIDTISAEVIISFGKAEAGIRPHNYYMKFTGSILPGTIIWSIGESPGSDCPCTVILNIDKGLNKITAIYIFDKNKVKWRAELTRRKKV